MHIAKVFTNGNSQAVRLPKRFRIAAKEVFIRKDAVTGDIVLSTQPAEGGWATFFALRDKLRPAEDYMRERLMNIVESPRDLFVAFAGNTKARTTTSTRRKPAKKP